MPDMRYRPELDGLRALAVLSVVALHSGTSIAGGGWMGVDVFFVLSGYLITSLLISERDQLGRVSLRSFYLRRILRLYPALLLVIIVSIPFYRQVGHGGTFRGFGIAAAAAATYLTDFLEGFHGHGLYSGLTATWSLSVEEQFYLIWPPVLIWLLIRRRDPAVWATFGAVASVAIAAISTHVSGQSSAYYLPWNHAAAPLAGCALAAVMARREPASSRHATATTWASAAVAVVILALGSKYMINPNWYWQFPVITLATVGIIYGLANSTGVLNTILSSAPFVWLGRRSYGVYLIHYPVLVVLRVHVQHSRLLLIVLLLGITIPAAALSYQFVEKPFLRFKARYRPRTEASIPVES